MLKHYSISLESHNLVLMIRKNYAQIEGFK